jgi:hypothetical protein
MGEVEDGFEREYMTEMMPAKQIIARRTTTLCGDSKLRRIAGHL